MRDGHSCHLCVVQHTVTKSWLIVGLFEAVAVSVAVAWGLGLRIPQHNRRSSCSMPPEPAVSGPYEGFVAACPVFDPDT